METKMSVRKRKHTSDFFHLTLQPKQLIGIIKQYNDLIIRTRTHAVFIMMMITFQYYEEKT